MGQMLGRARPGEEVVEAGLGRERSGVGAVPSDRQLAAAQLERRPLDHAQVRL
jgi:hypothetical protein